MQGFEKVRLGQVFSGLSFIREVYIRFGVSGGGILASEKDGLWRNRSGRRRDSISS